MKNKMLIAALAMMIAPGTAHADIFGKLFGKEADERLFSVEAALAKYSILYPDQKTGKTQTVRFACDIRVHVECKFEDGPGQYDIKIRRVENSDDPSKIYILGFHNQLKPALVYAEVEPVSYQQLIDGVAIQEAKGIPEGTVRIVADR